MEVILLIIAGVVLYYLYNGFQDYMKNPYKIENNQQYKSEYNIDDTPYVPDSPQDRIKKTEFGVLAAMLQCIASADGNVCKLEQELINDMLDDIANELHMYSDARILLQGIFDNNSDSLDDLAQRFAELTKGEYKRRLKVVEFLFALAYADGKLDEIEREKIIDVAAIFELNNDDFNIALNSILGQKLSVRETENLVKTIKTKTIKPNKNDIALNDDLHKIVNIFQNIQVDAKVSNNSIVLKFKNREKIDRFLQILSNLKD